MTAAITYVSGGERRRKVLDDYRACMKNQKRDRMEIIYSIVSLLEEEKRSLTEVMYICQLSYEQTTALRSDLVALGLMKLTVEHYWQITEKGRQWLPTLERTVAALAQEQ